MLKEESNLQKYSFSPEKDYILNEKNHLKTILNSDFTNEKSEITVLKAVNSSLQKHLKEKDIKINLSEKIIESQKKELYEKDELINSLYEKEIIANENKMKNELEKINKEKYLYLENKINVLYEKNEEICKMNERLIKEVQEYSDDKIRVDKQHSIQIGQIKNFWNELVINFFVSKLFYFK